MTGIRFGFLLFFLLSIARSDAFIFELHSIKKKNINLESPEWVIGLGDLHDKKHPISRAQKKQIMNFLSSLPKKQVKVLTEDLSSHGSFGRKECGNFYINSRGGVLGGFTQDCKAKGIDAENHEFRYCRVSSLGPVINNLDVDVSKLGSTAAISMAELHNEIQKEIDHIRQFDDGLVLNKIYSENIHNVQDMLTKLSIEQNDKTSVAEYLTKQVPKEKRLQFIKNLLTFDSELIDCKLTHAIKKERDKKYIIIIAGGAHVKRVCDLLMEDDYEKHTVRLAQDEQICNKDQCAGRPLIENRYCLMPQAIDLSCLPDCCDLKIR